MYAVASDASQVRPLGAVVIVPNSNRFPHPLVVLPNQLRASAGSKGLLSLGSTDSGLFTASLTDLATRQLR